MKNRNVLQKITIIALCIIIMITAMSGCSLKSLAVGDFLSYMKDKYGMDFTLVEDQTLHLLRTLIITVGLRILYMWNAPSIREKRFSWVGTALMVVKK